MKIFKMLSLIAFSFIVLQATAQNDVPKGFNKGTLVLADNSTVNGYVKDNIKRDASVILLNNGKEKSFNGSELVSAEINSNSFLCIKGDFFKVVSNGELSFLQKSSDASSKATFNGTEAMFNDGTEGNPGDYFIYDSRSKLLKLVSKKNLDEVIARSFDGYTPAIEKAKTAYADITKLKDAVEIYNGRKGK